MSKKMKVQVSTNAATPAGKPCATLICKANPFDTKDFLSDMTLEVEGKRLYVHKVIIVRASPVFKVVLFPEPGTGFKEEKAEVVPLPDKKCDDVVNFLKQIYVEFCHEPITDDTLVGIIALANECQQYIKGKLENSRNLSADALLMHLWICKRYPHMLRHLEKVIMTSIIDRTLQEVQRCDYYSQLSKDDQNELVLKRCQELEEQNN